MAAGSVIQADGAGRRREAPRGILRVDAAFDRVLFKLDVALVEIELLAVGDANLLLDQIDAGQLAAAAARMAALPIFLRRSAVRNGDGDSSINFW